MTESEPVDDPFLGHGLVALFSVFFFFFENYPDDDPAAALGIF